MKLPVLPRTYGSALNECSAWKERATVAEGQVVDLLAENGVLTAKVDDLTGKLAATKTAATGLQSALAAGAETSSVWQARDVDAQVLSLQGDLAIAREQIGRQAAALTAYETAHQELLDEIRRLAEERNTALGTVERMSRKGVWTPSGVAS